ncbi:MarR family winged helix-turn-helix transcriptional regulator [Cellulomonas algicola]|nr:MarR family transcriptional regulator [Cellulomonas algicola]
MVDAHVPPLTAQEEQLLRALARAVVRVPRAFEQDLGRAVGLRTTEYFTLLHLTEAPDGLRMGELAVESGLSLAGVTRVVTALERRGLVVRRPSTADGRGSEAVLTDPGRALLAEARPAQVASARRRVLDRLDGIDLQPCLDLLTRIGRD